MKSTPAEIAILSEVFRIVEGALRLDSAKVKNYSELLVARLNGMGQKASANRLQKLIAGQVGELRPTRLSSSSSLPVDQESRFPLLERLDVHSDPIKFCATEDQQAMIDEFCLAVEKQHLFEEQGIPSNNSLLLHGPPGCGKSHIAQVIAHRLGLPLLVARLDGVISSFLGSTSKNIRAIFECASKMPCVLFLDEFDALAKLRDDQHELGELKRVVNSFLQAFDSYTGQVNVVAATNHEQLLDPAVWRRFRFQLKLDRPDLEQRCTLWTTLSEGTAITEKELRALASLSEGMTGAEIKNTIIRLKQRAISQAIPVSAKDAAELLPSLSSAEVPRTFQIELRKGRESVTRWLCSRDDEVFNQTVVASLTGVSKSTISREMTPTKPDRTKRHA